MKLLRFDAKDALVLIAIAGLVATVNGVAMLSVPVAWIMGGVALIAWSAWRLS